MQKEVIPDPDVETEVGLDEEEPGTVGAEAEGPRRRGIGH